jgi:hypothetical protein
MQVRATRPLYSWERTSVTIEQETGRGLGLVRAVWRTEKIVSVGCRILDLSAHSLQCSLNTVLQAPYSLYFEVFLPVNFHIVGIFLTFILLMWRIGRAPNSIPIYSYIQQDATSHNLFISGNCSTCFGCYFHPSSGAHTTVSTASVICHTVTAICRYRGRVGTGLSVLWVAYATHRTLKHVPTLTR